MKRYLKKTFLFLGGDHFLRLLNRQPRIFFWHGVDHRIDSNVEREVYEVEVFEKQISYLNKFYEIISIEEFEKRFYQKCFSGKEVVLTFDDGYANNLYVVAPILNKLQLPFTVFVSTEHIEKGLYFPTSVNRIITLGAGLSKVVIPSQDLSFPLTTNAEREFAANTISHLLKSLPVDQVKLITSELINNVDYGVWEELNERFKSVRPLTWDEVKSLYSQGATIGSHCNWHICCHYNQSENEIKYEIEESKRIIENKLNVSCRYFAYPNGDYTEFSNKCVNECYSLGFSTSGREAITKCENNAIIPRIPIAGTIDTFRILINYNPR